MKKLSIIPYLILILTILTGCEIPKIKPVLLGNNLTINQFWNGILKDEDCTVYDQTHNPQRFAKTGNEDRVECVAIKDYNVYMMYDFGTSVDASDYLLDILNSWDKHNTDVECVPTSTGIFYIMRGQNNNCNVCYISDATLIFGMGNPEDETEIRTTIQNMIDSDDVEYDGSRIQTLPHVQNIKKVKIS